MHTISLPRFAAFAAGLIAMFGTALAQATHYVSPNDMGTGALLFKSDRPGKYVEAPVVATDFEVTVSGPIARTRVTQRFENPADGWVEGVYVFPLPDGSAVDTLKMVVGNRVIVGDVKEKQEAKLIYEEAKAQGQKAALLEQERPNLFTNNVANIGPHETIVIQMEYQEAVAQSGSTASLRVPLVMAPKYNPAPEAVMSDGNELVVLRDPVSDRARIEPPVLDPRESPPVNSVSMTIHLNPGYALGEIASPYHAISVTDMAPARKTITLKDGAIPANRDFALSWKTAAGNKPAVALFTEKVGSETYVLSYVTPPDAAPAQKRLPREVVFVIDNSGSMGGTSMSQAKASLLYALGRLDPADHFNVIRFDDTMNTVFPQAVIASPENVGIAKHYVGGLEAEGGTEMIPPLREALNDPNRMDVTTLRQVIFLTDGAIGNEQEMFDTLATKIGRSRVFMVGIGSAPNSYLMTRAAEIGRGTFTHIGSGEEVEARMRELFGKLESPVATSLRASFDSSAEITPNPLPDLYRGEPLTLLAKLEGPAAKLTVSGTLGGKPWQEKVEMTSAIEGSGIGKLWARRKISDAEVALTLGKISPEEADRRILALSLDHHLVSRMTSLVAIDKTPSRPDGVVLTRAEVPLNLPHGWDFDKLFGEKPKTKRAGVDERMIRIAAKPVTITKGLEQLQLPQTATPSELLILIGLILSLSGLGIAFTALRRLA
jgi:Ca-activated chloride channel family protein